MEKLFRDLIRVTKVSDVEYNIDLRECTPIESTMETVKIINDILAHNNKELKLEVENKGDIINLTLKDE